MSRWDIDKHQLSVLRRRYFSLVVGDTNALLMLGLQVLLIGGAIAGVWANVSGDSLSLYFVVCLCSFFFGAINSCREIVKEHVLFLRERMFNLSVPAYLLSKYWIQTIILALQCVALGVMVDMFVPLDVPLFVIIIVLLCVGTAGVSVGLLISSMVRSSDKAVVCVPLLVIPQILFSDFVLGAEQLHNWTEYAQALMPVYWGYELLKAWFNGDETWYLLVSKTLPLFLMGFLMYIVTILRLERVRE
jgi:ABC transport system ATP-binding/permease protein